MTDDTDDTEGLDGMDDRLDDTIGEMARSYHQPPGTPRDEMWARIEEARIGTRAGTRLRAGGISTRRWVTWHDTPIRRPARRVWAAWGIALAASLVLGFGLGRWQSVIRGERTTSSNLSATVADRAIPTPEPGCRVPSAECRVPSAAYQVAVVQHLARTEALLTSFRTDTRRGPADDVQLSAWAKELLGTTRLMLDSPAVADPRMRKLMQDLELVLAQLAQLGAARDTSEMSLIEDAVEGRNVLPRLRTAIPGGLIPAGS
ncbi:MAG: hypothetical protein WKG32_20040 [Gemmatimonadaceae bacterium]